MPNFFKKIIKEVSRPIQYAARTGSQETCETGRSKIGGQIIQIKTINLVDPRPEMIVQSNFDAYLRKKGVNEAGIAHFQCLKWIDIGSRERMEFNHKPNTTTCEKIGVAVRRIDEQSLKVSIVWKQSSVRVSMPETLIHKRTSHYGLGFRHSDNSTQRVGRGLSNEELGRVKEALEKEASKQNPQVEALQNV